MKDTLTVAKHDLKSIADIQYGFTAKANPDPVGPKFLRITDIQDGRVDWNLVPFCKATEAEITKFRLSPGEIVFARTGATTGKSYLIKDEVDAVFASYLIRLKPVGGRALPDYLAYYFQTPDYWDHVTTGTEGAAQGGFNASKLGRLEIPLPPLEEQKRIVAVLDQAFAALDRARAHAEANLADAGELFVSAVDELFQRNRHNWQHGTFGELVGTISTGPFGSLLHKSDYVENEVPIVNPADIVDGEIRPNWSKTITKGTANRLSSYVLAEGDLVIGRRGEMGRCAPVRAKMDGWLCGTGSFIIRTRRGVRSDLIAHLVRTPTFVQKLTAIATGTTMLNLSNEAIAKLDVDLPPPEAQDGLLMKIDGLHNSVTNLRNSLEKKSHDIADLRRSLLQKAFSGQLTA